MSIAAGPLAELEALYASLPTIACQGKCVTDCGVIACSPLEAERMRQLAGRPLTWDPATGGTCGYLKSGRCSVYARRPLICRVWGMVEDRPCQYGCKPSRLISALESARLFAEVDTIGGGVVTAVPRSTLAQHTSEQRRALVGWLVDSSG